MATVTRIDNVDPQIIYSGVWTTYNNNANYGNTISLARDINTSATLTFVGNSVSVFGNLGPHPSNAPAITKYEVDGDATIYAPPSPPQMTRGLRFYQSPPLPYGTHTLVMTNMVNLDWIWFDYFEVTNNGPPPAVTPDPTPTPSPTANSNSPSSNQAGGSSVSSASSNRSSSTTGSSTGSLPLSLISTTSGTFSSADTSQSFTPFIPMGAPTFIASSQGDSSSVSKTPTGAIVGGVIGALLLLTFIGAAALLFLRCRKQRSAQDVQTLESGSDPRHRGSMQTQAQAPQIYFNRSPEMSPREDSNLGTMSPTTGATYEPLSTSSMISTLSPGRITIPPSSKGGLQLATVTSQDVYLPPYTE